MNKKARIIAVIGILLILILGVASYAYMAVSSKFKIDKDVYIYIDKDKSYESVLEQVRDSAHIENILAFDKLSSVMKYKNNVKTGRYKVTPTMTVIDLVRELRAGMQTPIKVTFNNIRLKEDLIERLADQLMFSKDELAQQLSNEANLAKFGFDTTNVVAMFIPNTYELYWDISAEAFVERMHKEFNRFWSDAKVAKAKQLGLTPLQVSTLASIVEEECMYVDEYPTVAGLYLNRFNRGQLLQADPTVKYAVGDFTLRRVLLKHLEIDSPFNTYRYKGLPPAPIRVPSIKGLDAVLNRGEHDYIYMCAKEDFSGRHNFAKTLGEHTRNARKYQQELNKRRIY